jgi:hypothetical protein
VLRHHLLLPLSTSPTAAAAPGEQPHRQQQQHLKNGDDATAGDTHTKQRTDLDGDVPPTALELYQFDLNGVRAALLFRLIAIC